MKTKTPFLPGIAVSALLFVVGVVCWVLQLTQGLQLTNLNNFNTWGLYIVGFVLFTGVGAGALLFASCSCLFEGLRSFRPYARIASFVGAIGSVIAAGLFIIVDIGNPERVWYMIIYMNITSPIIWDAMILACYVVIGIIFTRQLVLVEQGKSSDKSLTPISIVAFIAALLVAVTSFVFAAQVARPTWHNAGQPISFFFAAVAAGLCLLMLVFAALSKSRYITIEDTVMSKIGKFAAIFLGAELAFVLSEVALALYAGAGEEYEVVQWLLSGPGTAFFWGEMIAILVGLVLLLNGKKNMLVAGAAVGFFAVFMVKYNLLQSQLANPLIAYPGPAAALNHGGAYIPSLIELGVSVGIVGLGALLVLLGLGRLNLGTEIKAEKKSKEAANI